IFVIAVVAAAASWYWGSPWPVALAAAFVAVDALSLARSIRSHTTVLWRLAQDARPMRMCWSFSVILTERAWQTMGIPPEYWATLQEQFGSYPGRHPEHVFERHPRPAWISRPIEVKYERWGESFERWTIL